MGYKGQERRKELILPLYFVSDSMPDTLSALFNPHNNSEK